MHQNHIWHIHTVCFISPMVCKSQIINLKWYHRRKTALFFLKEGSSRYFSFLINKLFSVNIYLAYLMKVKWKQSWASSDWMHFVYFFLSALPNVKLYVWRINCCSQMPRRSQWHPLHSVVFCLTSSLTLIWKHTKTHTLNRILPKPEPRPTALAYSIADLFDFAHEASKHVRTVVVSCQNRKRTHSTHMLSHMHTIITPEAGPRCHKMLK